MLYKDCILAPTKRTFSSSGLVSENRDAIISGGGEVTGGGGAGGPGDGGDGIGGGEVEGLAENGADASLVRGERGREVRDSEERRSGVSDP